jgi:hypothetical protein
MRHAHVPLLTSWNIVILWVTTAPFMALGMDNPTSSTSQHVTRRALLALVSLVFAV